MKKLLCICAVITMSIIVGFLLLCLVYCIPTRMMVDGGFDAAEIFESEGLWPYEGYRGLDNFSDAIMLNTASYHQDASVVKRAVEAYRGVIPETDPLETYVKMVWGTEKVDTESYSRFWHGYLVFLKPFYALFSYGQIRTINMIVQLSLMLVVALLVNKKYPNMVIPFALCILLFGPTAIYKSLHYSSVYYVMLFSALVLLWNPGNIVDGEKAIWLFLIVGIVTVYLDLLTSPTVTLTVPLVMVCYREKDKVVKNSLKLVLACTLMWGVGYALMWAGKWLISWVSDPDVFLQNLIGQIKLRSAATSDGSMRGSRLNTVRLTFAYLFMDVNLNLVIAAFSAICAVRVGLNIKHVKRTDFSFLLLLLVPLTFILFWILILSNHTRVHPYFTYRTVVPVVFCVLTFLSELAESAEKEKSKVKAVGTVQ